MNSNDDTNATMNIYTMRRGQQYIFGYYVAARLCQLEWGNIWIKGKSTMGKTESSLAD